MFERKLATAEEINDYWENATPIWKVRMPCGVLHRKSACLSLSAMNGKVLG